MKTNKIRHIALLLAAVVCMPLASCGKKDGQTVQAADLTADIKPQTVSGTDADDTFCLGQTAFALKLMQQAVKDDSGNVLISPYSVMEALAMTANGADGETLKQMEQTLGGLPIDTLNSYLYTQRMNQPNEKNCKLVDANSLWIKDKDNAITVEPDFLQTNMNYYGAGAFKEPFDQNTVKKINQWCSDHTDKMIPELLSGIDDTVVMYLINAVLFDAQWADPYLDEPLDRDFTAQNGDVQTAKMMYSSETRYLSDSHATGFVKPYSGGKYAFAALLPEEGMTVQDYIAGLTPESLRDTLENQQYGDVRAGLPEFTYDYDTTLSDALSEMGMQQAFDSSADFSRMGKTQTGYLYISEVLHKTHIQVDVNGTKAAAVTAVAMDSCAAPAEEEPKYVILDRPFLYMILDTETNLPVFIGTLTEIP
ncbi:MAG: serpin family protein [Oscillospiraceae bacterium]|nr:serpin family protein [Oscillospiraceae bacterium]